MTKVIRLKESDIHRMVKMVLNEQSRDGAAWIANVIKSMKNNDKIFQQMNDDYALVPQEYKEVIQSIYKTADRIDLPSKENEFTYIVYDKYDKELYTEKK